MLMHSADARRLIGCRARRPGPSSTRRCGVGLPPGPRAARAVRCDLHRAARPSGGRRASSGSAPCAGPEGTSMVASGPRRCRLARPGRTSMLASARASDGRAAASRLGCRPVTTPARTARAPCTDRPVARATPRTDLITSAGRFLVSTPPPGWPPPLAGAARAAGGHRALLIERTSKRRSGGVTSIAPPATNRGPGPGRTARRSGAAPAGTSSLRSGRRTLRSPGAGPMRPSMSAEVAGAPRELHVSREARGSRADTGTPHRRARPARPPVAERGLSREPGARSPPDEERPRRSTGQGRSLASRPPS